MVLYGTLYGRVGRCRISLKESEQTARTFSYAFSRMRAERMRLSRLPLARADLRPPPRQGIDNGRDAEYNLYINAAQADAAEGI